MRRWFLICSFNSSHTTEILAFSLTLALFHRRRSVFSNFSHSRSRCRLDFCGFTGRFSAISPNTFHIRSQLRTSGMRFFSVLSWALLRTTSNPSHKLLSLPRWNLILARGGLPWCWKLEHTRNGHILMLCEGLPPKLLEKAEMTSLMLRFVYVTK